MPAGTASVCRVASVGLQLGLLEESLEGAAAGEDAVAEGDRLPAPAGDEHLGGDGEDVAAQAPGGGEGGGAFVGVLDDVEDVAEVDDVGGLAGRVGSEGGVPAGAGDAVGGEEFEVLAAAAAVVEEGDVAVEEVVAEEALDRAGEVAAADGGFVAGDGCRFHDTPVLRRASYRETHQIADGARGVRGRQVADAAVQV
jgi:hypothetical protein